MSINTLTILQIIGIAICYFLSTLVLPWLFFRRKFKNLSIPMKFMTYFIIGNFYIINLVLLLQLVHLSYRVTLIVGTVLPFLIVYIRKNWGQLRKKFTKAADILLRFFEHRLTIKTILDKFSRKISDMHRKRRFKKKNPFFILEVILTVVVTVLVIFIYAKNIFQGLNYQASDVIVHNEWINEMGNNNIFSKGVYPFGFHCIIYYLHIVYGIKTMTLLRLFSLIQTVMIYLMMLAFMKTVCKSRYIPYFSVAGYLLFDFFYEGTYTRFGATLPQEFGMIFILPSICYLIEFFKRYKQQNEETSTEGVKEADTAIEGVKEANTAIEGVKEANTAIEGVKEADTAVKRKINFKRWFKRPVSDWYLLLFAISISLTLASHFYNTIIAVLFCVGVAAGFVTRFVHWKYFKKIMLAGILGIVIAVVPMFVGYLQGKGLNGSLYWGLSVISGEEKDDAGTGDESQTDSDSLYPIFETELKDASLYTKAGYIVGIDLLNAELFLIDEQLELYDVDSEILVGKILLMFPLIMILVGITGCFLSKKIKELTQEYCMTIISMGVYIALTFTMLCGEILGIPQLMSNFRTIIYLAYSIMAAAGLFVDAVISYACCACKNIHVKNAASFALSAAVICIVAINDMIKEPLSILNEFGTNEAILCTENILHDNKGKDYTWTIVSANDENRMISDYGRHYEIITFLRDMKDIEEEPELTIPTETVYFYIEKLPINYDDEKNESEGYVSEEGACEPIYGSSNLGAYQGSNRWVTMSHMYYWAKEFKKLYPNEMEVYYENDNFICYRVQQNTYSLYNFAIDYGYNNPTVSKLTDEDKEED